MKSLNVLICDNQKIVRQGLKSLFKRRTGWEVFHTSLDQEHVIQTCRENPVNLLIVDIYSNAINGIEFIKSIKQEFPDLCILIFTMMQKEYYIREMVRAEANGYLLKSSGFDELLEAIHSIVNGKRYFSEKITMSVMQTLKKKNGGHYYEEPSRSLTDRELEVLELICEEYTNQEIADKLYISVRTVDAHRRNLLQKTGSRNTAGLVRFAVENRCI